MGEWASLRVEILLRKKFRKSLQREGDDGVWFVSRGLIIELRTLKRTWGLWELFDTRLEMYNVLAVLTAVW